MLLISLAEYKIESEFSRLVAVISLESVSIVDDPICTIVVRRTGRVYSFASSEFIVTYPDGSEGVVWSPPWHDMTCEEEELAARMYAIGLYAKREHVELK